MACYAPLAAFRTASGSVVFIPRGGDGDCQELQLPCGRCQGCRLERSRQWAMRCVHEASQHKQNCAITLTYEDAHLPPLGSLRYRDFQLFMKRLRRQVGAVRFYMAGEYGSEPYEPYLDKFGRPHFHAALFGVDFPDKFRWQKSKGNTWLYRSAQLERLWPFGNSLVGDMDFRSAAYIARYIMKKINGDMADLHYSRVDLNTGEVGKIVPEFSHMSLKPGIGAWWFARYFDDVYVKDRVVINGKEVKPPRRYDQWFKECFPDEWMEIYKDRDEDGKSRYLDNTPDRLVVKSEVNDARIRFLSRSLK